MPRISLIFRVETEASKQKYHTYQWSRTRMGGWAVAQCPIFITTVTFERLRKRGYAFPLPENSTTS